MLMRIIILLATVVAYWYGIVQKLLGYNRKYFNVAFFGMTALFLARFYYLVVVLSNGNDEILTIGVLGQVSAYLFFMTANIKFLSRAVLKQTREKICVPGLLGMLVLIALFMVPAVIVGTVSGYICEILYALSIGFAFYIAVNAITYRKDNVAAGAVWKFNACVCVLAGLNALSEFSKVIFTGGVLNIILWVMTVLCSVVMVLMLPVLKRGMMSWPQ